MCYNDGVGNLSYNGSGTFNINTAGQPVVTGTVISSTAFNALTADLATGLSTAITKDGQTTTTARIAFAQGVSSTLVTDATSATTGSIITAGGISCQKALWVGTTSRHVGATQFDAAITYGGVTLSNAVTGTGNMVLSASPTLTGTLAAAAATFSGQTVVGTSGAPGGFTPYLYANGLRISGGDTTNTIYQATGALVLSTGSSAAISFAPNVTTVATINGSGLGIGMTPTYPLDITIAANSEQLVRFYNSTSGTAAVAGFQLKNNAPDLAGLNLYSTAFTTSGVKRAGGTYLYSGGDGGLTINTQTAQPIYFGINNSEVARFDTSGRLGIGMTPSNVLDITQTTNGLANIGLTNGSTGTSAAAFSKYTNSASSSYVGVFGGSYTTSGINRQDGLIVQAGGTGGITLNTATSQPIYFTINNSEVARFDTSGNLLVGTPSAPNSQINKSNNGGIVFQITNTGNSTPNGQTIYFSAAAPNNTTQYFLRCLDNVADRLYIYANGNVVNTNNSYGAISDIVLKDNIVDATPKSNDLMKVKIKNFSLKSDPNKTKQIGVVAQELEEVFPGMVEEDGNGIKNVKYSVFVPILVKAFQELKAEFDAYKATHP